MSKLPILILRTGAEIPASIKYAAILACFPKSPALIFKFLLRNLDNLDEICATPGLDAVYIGPSDLSLALDLKPRGDNPDPLHLETCDKILEIAHKHGIKAVMHCASGEFASGAIKRGFDMVMLTSDLASMIAGVKSQLDTFKANTG